MRVGSLAGQLHRLKIRLFRYVVARLQTLLRPSYYDLAEYLDTPHELQHCEWCAWGGHKRSCNPIIALSDVLGSLLTP